MEFLKNLSPEKRKKLNIGLLAFTGLQLLLVFVLQVVLSSSAPVRKLADLPTEPLKKPLAARPMKAKKQAGPVKKLPPPKVKLGNKARPFRSLDRRLAKAPAGRSEIDVQ